MGTGLSSAEVTFGRELTAEEQGKSPQEEGTESIKSLRPEAAECH